MISDCIPDHMKMKIYRELRTWYLNLEVSDLPKPEYEKIYGQQKIENKASTKENIKSTNL